MPQPNPIVQRERVTRRLGIKSSISNVKALLASVYLFWMIGGRTSRIEYADPESSGTDRLTINPALSHALDKYFSDHGFTRPENLIEKLESSPLFTAQIEPLQVALQLIWKLAKIELSYAGLAERTGGLRHSKKLSFSVMVDALDLLMQDDDGNDRAETINILLKWLGCEVPLEEKLADKLERFLTILSEDTHMKHKYNGEDLVFQQNGIYQALLSREDEPMQFTGERVGPLRIISRAVSEDIHPYLEENQSRFTLRAENKVALSGYTERVDNYLDLIETYQETIIETETPENTGESKEDRNTSERIIRNLIIYGAPGTGKSYYLEKERRRIGIKETHRVIFYPDYTYAQFVGGYRPSHLYDSSSGDKSYSTLDRKEETRPGEPIVEYQFVPGPLINLLIHALKDPENPYLLLIEELNRADASAVFGDIFQLLDRDESGWSRYGIKLSALAMSYLRVQNVTGGTVRLPPNLFIWATLNNADQGVTPLDTAFKRRWEFRYMSLEEGSHVTDSYVLRSNFRDEDNNKIDISWNEFRRRLNKQLALLGVDEDMHIGPFFLSEEELKDDVAFRYKLLSYLRDDVLRHRADELFISEGTTLSDLLQLYDQGKNIFRFQID